MEPGIIHVITEIGGCIVDLPPDIFRIQDSLNAYARRNGMKTLRSLDPSADDLSEWEDMVQFASQSYRIEGPVLVGEHQGERTLIAVAKLYGYPGPGVDLGDRFSIVRFPDGTPL